LYIVFSSFSFTISISKNIELNIDLKNIFVLLIEGGFSNMDIDMNFLGLNGFDGDREGIRRIEIYLS
jgi:hypothetical protein